MQKLLVVLIAMLLALGTVTGSAGQGLAAGAPVIGSYSRVANTWTVNLRSGPDAEFASLPGTGST